MLQLDPCAQYGGGWASLRLNELESLLQEAGGGDSGSGSGDANGGAHADDLSSSTSSSSSGAAAGEERVRQEAAAAAAAAGITGAEVWRRQGAELGAAQQYSLDLAPKASARL